MSDIQSRIKQVINRALFQEIARIARHSAKHGDDPTHNELIREIMATIKNQSSSFEFNSSITPEIFKKISMITYCLTKVGFTQVLAAIALQIFFAPIDVTDEEQEFFTSIFSTSKELLKNGNSSDIIFQSLDLIRSYSTSTVLQDIIRQAEEYIPTFDTTSYPE